MRARQIVWVDLVYDLTEFFAKFDTSTRSFNSRHLIQGCDKQ